MRARDVRKCEEPALRCPEPQAQQVPEGLFKKSTEQGEVMETVESFSATIRGHHLYVAISRIYPNDLPGISWQLNFSALGLLNQPMAARQRAALGLLRKDFPLHEVSNVPVRWQVETIDDDTSTLHGFVVASDDVVALKLASPWKRISQY